MATRVLIGSAWAGVAICLTFVGGRLTRLLSDWQRFKMTLDPAWVVPEDPVNRYDPTLGWKHIPGKTVDMEPVFAGEDIVFQINSNGFRAIQDYCPEIPGGRSRIVLVGDSFTFGFVRFEDTFGALIETLDPRYQVINMGACAYGVDQMFLWYAEDGIGFDSDLVIVAIMEDDIRRARSDRWSSGHGRPLFQLIGDDLVLTNVPVPHRIPPGTRNVRPSDVMRFLRLRRGLSPSDPGAEDVPFQVLRAFRDLVEEAGKAFLIVYLPTHSDFDEGDQIRRGILNRCGELGLPVLDLGEWMKKHIVNDDSELLRSDGHYNSRGNALVAKAILRYLNRHRPSKTPMDGAGPAG